MKKYFKQAGNLEEENSNITIESNNINDYLLTIVSGKEYGFDCELGSLCAGGKAIITFERLQEMVDEGTYNIIKASYLGSNMISIEYQKYSKLNTRCGRF